MVEDLNTVSNYLARRDVSELTMEAIQEPVAVLVLLGCSLVEPIHVAATALRQGLARRLLISGGIGHSTQYLYDTIGAHPEYHDIPTAGRAEADIFFDILTQCLAVPGEAILVENESTTCGFNAEASRRLLDNRRLDADSLLLIQDPTMQRRSHACFVRQWQDKPHTRIQSFAAFIPQVVERAGVYEIIGSHDAVWPFERFTALVLGEIPRLRDDEQGYGPRGRNFIDHIDIPQPVVAAYDRLAIQLPKLARA